MCACSIRVLLAGTALAMIGCLNAAPISTCTVTGGSVILTEPPEGGLEVLPCSLPAGIPPPLLFTGLVLTENQTGPPPIISDAVLITTVGLVTFYSDPSIPELPPNVEFQTEAASNTFTVNGTSYVVVSDAGPEPIPEPATIVIVGAGMLLLGALRTVRSRVR